jgi:hypothetical protein
VIEDDHLDPHEEDRVKTLKCKLKKSVLRMSNGWNWVRNVCNDALVLAVLNLKFYFQRFN